ncbi:MFS transporter [Siphonobacter sp. SORGH_AS_0500]|uniref:MFS transporter n=1 Tax=Siphonobacter sp. SORGH_AS_0500 TaxID=1864824 RepID=UPI000CC57E38|nr:MFS transporter [Siphonobacter sp. SORGH_AS_0500]PKK37949.1 MFS transporter [Siphonobacter sp. SORGH_AS_0500]
MAFIKPSLSFRSIINMNVGFFGIQYSFGLQQTNMTPLYSYLGANPDDIPLLNLAGPMTGLIIQPIVGAMSDKTISRFGRRVPYFMIGAIFCSICLLLMPFSRTLWMAAGLLWILDAANNITMEPYRAFVSDKLPPSQHATGFLTQSFFTGLGITLANLTPSLLVASGLILENSRSSNHITYSTYAAFLIGAVASLTSVFYTIFTTKEYPLTEQQIQQIKQETHHGIGYIFRDIAQAFQDMPPLMRRLGVVYLFNWYAMFVYWQFITLCLAKTIFNTQDPNSLAFSSAQLLTGKVNATYNIVTFCTAFLLGWLAKKISPVGIHTLSLLLAGVGLLVLPLISNTSLLFLPMIGFGIGWASMMGTPYVILAGSIPEEKTGIYMGILNMFIVMPMMLETLTFRYIYRYVLQGNPVYAIYFAGVLITIAAALTLTLKMGRTRQPELAYASR